MTKAGIKNSSDLSSATVRYLPYLEEAQRKLLTVAAGFFIAAVLGFVYYRQILKFIMGQFDLDGINIVLTNPYQVVGLAINTGLFTGLLVAIPLLVYHALAFLKPALKAKEFKLLMSLLPLSFVLFVSGFAFGVYVVQFVIRIFSKATLDFSVSNLWDIGRFFSQILFSALSLGIVFQFPIILTMLIKTNVVSRAQVIDKRRHVYAAALVFAALLPPTDIFSLILMVIPLFLLFELTLLFNRQ